MSSNMWQQRGVKSLTLILLLAVICAPAATMPTVEQEQQQQEQQLQMMTTEMSMEKEQQKSASKFERIDCKLTFDPTMDSLERQKLLQANGCNTNTNKPATMKQQKEQPGNVLRHSLSGGSSQPLYELQLVVWPTDIEDEADTTPTRPTTTRPPPPTTTRTTTTTTRPPTTTRRTTRRTTTTTTAPTPTVFPLYEDQLAVFPQMDFEEENFDYFFDELEAAAPMTTTTTRRPTVVWKPSPAVYVLENYHNIHPNGTEEHKLVLSNGLINYMKIYAKMVDNKLINVQEGYSSVPVAGIKPQIQTVHYIADEHGYNIHKMVRSPFPSLLDYRVEQKATKVPVIKPHV